MAEVGNPGSTTTGLPFVTAKQIGFPAWVDVAVDKAEGVFKKSPDRDEFAADVNESLIVELYSR